MKISLCMVLRDEGKTIERCLTSLKGLVDEWIIGIDKQTIDNTRDVVNKFFTDNPILEKNIYEYEWKDSFSKARNEGMDKATGDYILIMDGHEFIPVSFFNITEKREITMDIAWEVMKTSLVNDKPDVGHFQLYQQPFIGNTPNNFFLQPRIYRNDKDIRFNRDAHNTIINTKLDVNYPELIIIHDAPEDNRVWRKEQRIRMNTKALQDDIEKNPLDTRAMFYLGNTRMEAEDFSQAVYHFDRYLNTCKVENSEKYQVLLHKAIAHIALKEYTQARDSLSLAIGVDPFRRDAYITLGTLYLDNKEYDKAVAHYSNALRCPVHQSRMFQSGASATWDVHQRIAFAFKELGQREKAVAHFKTALSYLDHEEWKKEVDELTKTKPNLLILDHIGSFTKDIVDRLRKTEKFNLVYLQNYDARMVQWADMIWCEWGDVNALRCAKAVPQKTVIRLIGYEAYTNKEMLTMIDWSKIKKVVFIAKHIQEMVSDIIPLDKGVVIPCGVDLDKFKITKTERDPKNIGYVGLINEKKNPYLLIKIIKANPDKVFHLRADFQSPFWKETFNYELKGHNNVIFYPRLDKIEDFWNNMSYTLSNSIIESFSYNLAEGMACGCIPVVYNWRGAKDLWRAEDIFDDMPTFKEVTEKDRQEARQYVIDTFDAGVHVPKLIDTIIRG
jgi:glycosyltransferase involved in cell wall biosynthesis